MENMQVLNSKEKKKIFKNMKEQWNTDIDNIKDFIYLRTNTGKIFVSNKEIAEIEQIINIRKYSMGNYIATETPHGLRVSIEGSQLIGPISNKNIVELDDTDIKKWMSGKDISITVKKADGFCLIKNKNDFYGCGRVRSTDIMNFVPKSRRLKIN